MEQREYYVSKVTFSEKEKQEMRAKGLTEEEIAQKAQRANEKITPEEVAQKKYEKDVVNQTEKDDEIWKKIQKENQER